ncbi:MAG: 3'-5' exonuclease [bacterium]|nr:3'-5' exonuclease [bacterium]
MTNQDFIIVDVETTGFRPEEGHCVIEIAAELLRDGRVAQTFHSLVLSEQPLSEEAISIHGITEDLLQKEGRPANEVFPDFVKFAAQIPLIGHNVAFDLGFINTHLKRLNLQVMNNLIIDTVELARRHLILPSYSLEKVAAYLKVPQPSAHRAGVDVAVTRQVFLKLNERANGNISPTTAPKSVIDIPAPRSTLRNFNTNNDHPRLF